MLNKTEKEAIEKGMKTLWFIWVAIMGSLLIYFFIAHALGNEIRPPMGEDFPLEHFRNILYGLSVIILFLAHFSRKLIMKAKDKNTSSELFKYKTQLNQPLFVSKYTAAVVISLAFSESIAIFGLVLFFVGADYQTFYIFLVISAFAMFFYRPKKTEVEELALVSQPKSTI